MSIIIDGYNLLNCAGIVAEADGPYSLEKSRQALLNFLAATLENHQLSETTVVFDASNAPPGLPRSYSQFGITILFAERNRDADALIAELVGQHSAPKSLTVVSSDHAVQRAAKRRKAKYCDSDAWFAAQVRHRISRAHTHRSSGKPQSPLTAAEVAEWISEFDVDPREMEKESPAPTSEADKQSQSGQRSDPESAKSQLEKSGFNPFPDGYGEDLLGDES